MCSPPPSLCTEEYLYDHAWRDVIVTDCDEVTMSNDRRSLLASAGGLGVL